MMKFIDKDFHKLADDYKRISEALIVLKDTKHKDSAVFDVAMDLVIRELDRLFLDISQIHQNSEEK